MIQNLSGEKLYAVVLAEGNGTRLHQLAEERSGCKLPRQYLPAVGGRSLLELTWARIERLIPHKKILTVVAQQHLVHLDVTRQLSARVADTILAQPENKGTAAAILFSLMHIDHRFPDAIIAAFPCCHHVRQASWFMRYVRLAAQAVEINPQQIVLLGIVPPQAESAYGYLIAHDIIQQPCAVDLLRLAQFIDQPPPPEAQRIVETGGFWNTGVTVFKGSTVVQSMKEKLPELYEAFAPLRRALGTIAEKETTEEIYGNLPSRDFQRDFLRRLLHDLSVTVLPVRNVLWSDWGIPDRLWSDLDPKIDEAAKPNPPPQSRSNVLADASAQNKYAPNLG